MSEHDCPFHALAGLLRIAYAHLLEHVVYLDATEVPGHPPPGLNGTATFRALDTVFLTGLVRQLRLLGLPGVGLLLGGVGRQLGGSCLVSLNILYNSLFSK